MHGSKVAMYIGYPPCQFTGEAILFQQARQANPSQLHQVMVVKSGMVHYSQLNEYILGPGFVAHLRSTKDTNS